MNSMTRASVANFEDSSLSIHTMPFAEIARLAIDSFQQSKIRFMLTALGMVIGTASLILVVTIGLTGKQYALNQIQSIGANMVYAYYETGGSAAVSTVQQDQLTVEDVTAVRNQVPGILASSPMLEIHDRIAIGSGKERDILVLGVDPDYRIVRNLVIVSGRFFDDEDSLSRNKVALVTPSFAKKAFGSVQAAVGHSLKVNGLPFVVIGVFKERVQTFGLSEIADDTVLIPFNVGRYFTSSDAITQAFFTVSDPGNVTNATEEIRKVLQSRHRPESNYRVDNLSQVIDVAAKIANSLTVVLLCISAITLVVSGVGIMNIMLANVRARIREIGIRKAVGATNREIRLQFLTEAVFISLCGGLIGTVIGLAIPFSVRFFTDFRIPISGLSALIAIVVASMVGIIFGTVPAARAAEMDPVTSLHYE